MSFADLGAEALVAALRRGEADVGVAGLGYIGLPLAAVLADAGFRVLGFDRSWERVDAVAHGRSPIHEKWLDELLQRVVGPKEKKASLEVSAEPSVFRNAAIVFITVGTPVDQEGRADLSQVTGAATMVGEHLPAGAIAVLESTVPPGTTDGIFSKTLRAAAGSRPVGVAFSPERTVAGNAIEEFRTLPKIVGASDERSAKVTAAVLGALGGSVRIVSSTAVAEMVKLMDNTYRDVNVALANEFARAAEGFGVDVMEAIAAANEGYARNHILIPGAGVGGSCLPKDPLLLSAAAREVGVQIPLVDLARRRNEAMPSHVCRLVQEALHAVGRQLRSSRVALLGLAFKGNTDDLRNAPSIEIARILETSGATVVGHDPFVSSERLREHFGMIDEASDPKGAATGSDCLVVLSDHDNFRTLDLIALGAVMRSRSIVDGRHLIDPRSALAAGFHYRGVGRPPEAFSIAK